MKAITAAHLTTDSHVARLMRINLQEIVPPQAIEYEMIYRDVRD
jgi:hypothetical protein